MELSAKRRYGVGVNAYNAVLTLGGLPYKNDGGARRTF